MKIILSLLFVFLSYSCLAITWVDTEVDDPFLEGKKCDVNEPASYGSYIYQWPSKYDQVFWPYIELNGIWYCKESGYVSFMSDFKDIKESEKNRIASYLKKNKKKDPSEKELLIALEEIYSLREIEPEYRNILLRVFARWYQGFDEIEKANEYRKKAFAEIKEELSGELVEYKKLEYLYLASNYSRLFGKVEDSVKYTKKLITAIDNLKDKKLAGFAEYLKELSKDTIYIVPGGQIEPQENQQENK